MLMFKGSAYLFMFAILQFIIVVSEQYGFMEVRNIPIYIEDLEGAIALVGAIILDELEKKK